MFIFVLLLTVCSVWSTDQGCPRGQRMLGRIQECMADMTMAGDRDQFCSNAWSSMDCLDRTYSQCQNAPEWHAVMNSEAVQSQHQTIQMMCGPKPSSDDAAESDDDDAAESDDDDVIDRTCTTNLMAEVEKCNSGLEAFIEASPAQRRSKCGEVYESITCMRTLSNRCQGSSLLRMSTASVESLFTSIQELCGENWK